MAYPAFVKWNLIIYNYTLKITSLIKERLSSLHWNLFVWSHGEQIVLQKIALMLLNFYRILKTIFVRLYGKKTTIAHFKIYLLTFVFSMNWSTWCLDVTNLDESQPILTCFCDTSTLCSFGLSRKCALVKMSANAASCSGNLLRLLPSKFLLVITYKWTILLWWPLAK